MRAYSTSPRPTVSPRKPPKRTEPSNAIRGVNQHVAHRLKTLRRTRFKTQTELGAAVGMTFQQMAKYERGLSKIAPGMLWKLAEYFEVDIGYFFEGLDGTTPGPELHQTVQRRLRLELVKALDAVTDDRLLRSLRVFLHTLHERDRDD